MRYPLVVPGFENQSLEVDVDVWWSGARLFVDGQPAPKGAKRGQLRLRRDDGSEALATLKLSNPLDPIPQVVIDGQVFQIAEPLKWYELVWGGIPFLLVFVGGLIGGLFGGFGALINSRLFRTNWIPALKYAATALVTVLAVLGYWVSAGLFRSGIDGLFAGDKETSSAEGRFRVAAPVALEETIESVAMPDGSSLALHNFIGEQNNRAYFVAYNDYPAEIIEQNDPQTLLDGTRNGSVQSMNGTLISESQITLNGYPGRELIAEAPLEDGNILAVKARIFIVENRLYQLFVAAPQAEISSADVDAFLNSFELLQD